MGNFEDDLNEQLKEPHFAALYIISAINENDPDFIKVALGDVIKAHGFSRISENTGIARQALYKMVSEEGNPTVKNLNKLLNSVGLELDVRAKSV